MKDKNGKEICVGDIIRGKYFIDREMGTTIHTAIVKENHNWNNWTIDTIEVVGNINNKEPIKIWPFYDAPQELQDLSTNGGDEDWIAVVPDYLKDEWLPWMETGSTFGCCCVNEYDHPSIKGYKIRIGCHS